MATIHISDDLDRRLNEAAERFGQSRTELVTEALRLRFEEINHRGGMHLNEIGESTTPKD